MAILVQTKTTDFAARQKIRETWKHECDASHYCFCIFVVGRPTNNEDDNRGLAEEASQRQDILQMDVAEAYQNLTLKTMFSIQWVTLVT